jgi:hypothetical protein
LGKPNSELKTKRNSFEAEFSVAGKRIDFMTYNAQNFRMRVTTPEKEISFN